MRFEYTDEQKEIRQRVRDFAEKEVAPRAAKLDREHEFPHDLVKRMAEIGIMGMLVPKEYGGTANSTVAYTIAIEELARCCASTAITMAVHNSLAIYPMITYTTEEQKKKYLIDLAKGKKLGAFSLTEPTAGSDATNLQTTAALKGDKYILNGNKIFVTSGSAADIYIVIASTDRAKKHKGISAFIVEKDFKGFSIGAIEEKLGIQGSKTSELVFEDCEVPRENILGGEGMGFKIAMATLDCGRIGVAAQALGIAQSSLDDCMKFARNRKQFGNAIGKHQFVQWTIADMATRVDCARMLTQRAAFNKDAGLKYTLEAAMAKLYASETAMWASERAIQLHGGRGYLDEYAVERHFRDAKITEIYEGTSEVQKMVIANNLGL